MKNSLSPVRHSQHDEKNIHDEMNRRQEKIRVLLEEINSFEQKNTTLKHQVQHNENILNILEEKNILNKEFLTRLQGAIESKKQTTFSIADPFIKHNYKKLREIVGEDDDNGNNQEKGLAVPSDSKKSRNRSNSRFSEDKSNDMPKVEQIRMENDYMLKVMSKDDSVPVPLHYKCWTGNN